jgi:hypothetical protein
LELRSLTPRPVNGQGRARSSQVRAPPDQTFDRISRRNASANAYARYVHRAMRGARTDRALSPSGHDDNRSRAARQRWSLERCLLVQAPWVMWQRFCKPHDDERNPQISNDLHAPARCCCTQCCAALAETDEALATLLLAWPNLPVHIRAAIGALVVTLGE